MREAEECRTLDEVIEDLEQLRRDHGGSLQVLSSVGGVAFRFFTFSQEEKRREGVKDFVGIVTDDGQLL